MGGKPVVTANKELLANAGARAVRDRRGRGRRPPVRGVGRRRHPAHPAAARVAGRRPHPPGHGHRQRHHQLHPHPHDRRRRVVRRRARRGAARSGSPSPTPPPTSRASTPRPRRRSSRRSRSARASSPATCTARASPSITADDIASAARPRLRREAARGRRGARRRGRGARAPGDGAGRATRSPSVRDSFNAVFIEGDAVGELMLYGRGAGGAPTASAVLGDLVDAAKNLVEGRKGATIGTLAPKPIRADRRRRVAVLPDDRGAPTGPACSRAIAGVFGEHGVSIQSMQQRGQRRRRPPHLRHPQGARGRPARRRCDAVRERRRGRTGSARCCG